MPGARDDGAPLAAERAAAALAVADLRTELAGIIEAQEADPPDDEHDVEGSSVGFERARVAALLGRAEARLAALDDAAARFAAGEGYGRCEGCGTAIAPERLDALPATRQCIDCARR